MQLGGSGSGWAVSLFSSGGSGGGGAATNTISPFATDALSPFASSAASSVAALSKDDSGTGTPDGDEADDAALVDELAAEAAEDMGGRGAAARVREVSQQLVNIASSLSPDNASMLLQSGFSMVRCVGVLKEALRERLHEHCGSMLVCGCADAVPLSRSSQPSCAQSYSSAHPHSREEECCSRRLSCGTNAAGSRCWLCPPCPL